MVAGSKTMVKSPLNWYGGKYYMASKLLPLIQNIPHNLYGEVFGGAGHLVFMKIPSKVDVYNDLNSGLYNFMTVLRNDGGSLIQKLQLTPYSREEYDNCKNWAEVEDPIEKARQFFVRSQQSYSNTFGSWSYSTISRRGMASVVSRWLSQVDDKLLYAINRIREITIENLPFEDFINRYDRPDTLFYLDPTYLPKTRESKKVYKHEMTYDDHVRLVKSLKVIKGKAILSGYDNALYDTLGWEKESIGEFTLYASKSKQGKDKPKKSEIVWIKD